MKLRALLGIALMVLVGEGTQAAPAAPVLSPPEVNGTTVSLVWTIPFGTTAIRLDAGTAPGLANAANATLGLMTGYTATNVPPGIYYVRVRALDPSGESPSLE